MFDDISVVVCMKGMLIIKYKILVKFLFVYSVL